LKRKESCSVIAPGRIKKSAVARSSKIKKMTCYYLKFLVVECILELLLFTPHIVSASFNMTVYENLKLSKKVEANKGLTKDSTEDLHSPLKVN